MNDRSGRVDLDELAALEEQRAFLLTSLDDLDREHAAGDLDDDDYVTLRDDYTARTARVLEAIEERHELIDASPSPRRAGRRLLVMFAVVVVAAVAGLVVTTTSGTDRVDGDDNVVTEPSSETQACIDMMAPALVPGEQDGDTSAVDVLQCFTDRIDAAPDDVVAYTYRGRTLAMLATQLRQVATPEDVASFSARSQADLTRALELNPDFPDALAFAALGALGDGDVEAARGYVDRLDALRLPGNDPIVPMVNNAIRPALAEAEADAPTPTTTTP